MASRAPRVEPAAIATDNPDFARRNPGLRVVADAPAKKTVVRRRRSPERIRIERANARIAEARANKAEAPPAPKPVPFKAGPSPKFGPAPGVRNAAAATNRVAARVGRTQRVTRRGFGGGGSIAGVIVFATGVGVFLWLVRNPTVLPKLIAFVTTIIHDVLTLGVHP